MMKKKTHPDWIFQVLVVTPSVLFSFCVPTNCDFLLHSRTPYPGFSPQFNIHVPQFWDDTQVV